MVNRENTLKIKYRQRNRSPPLVFPQNRLHDTYMYNTPNENNTDRNIWMSDSKDEEAKLLFEKKPVFAFSRHRNLKDILTSAISK